MSQHTFDIVDGAGFGLATVTFRNMTRSTATGEARKVAKALSPQDWAISHKEPEPSADPTEDNFNWLMGVQL